MQPSPPVPDPAASAPLAAPPIGLPAGADGAPSDAPPFPNAPGTEATTPSTATDPTLPHKPIPPPQITPDSTLKPPRANAADIKNPFERTATLLVDAAGDYAKRMADNLSEQPADTAEADPRTVNEMMHFSPYGTDAPRVFWQKHDELLQQAADANDPDPYAVAERGALDEVYPYRAKLALLDVLGPDEKVARAEQLMRIAHGQMAKGHTPESMPFNVGPQALPPDQAEGVKGSIG